MLTVTTPHPAKTPPLRRTPHAARLIALGAALLLPLAGAFAQSSLPDEMFRKQEIAEADRQLIRSFIEANKSGLSGGAAEVKKSRETLVAPLEKLGGVSVPFRVAYANALIEIGGLKTLAANKDSDLIATNALRIAGQAATGNTLSIILDGLKDTRPQVRYAATVAARAAFTAAKTTPALSPDEIARAMRALGEVAATDAAKEPVDGAIQALIAAREIADNRSAAIVRLTEAAGKRAMLAAKSDQADTLAPLLRVVAALRVDITEQGTLSAEARKSAAAFAGQTLVAIGAHWKEGAEPTEAMIQGAKAASGVLELIDNKGRIKIGDAAAPGKRDMFMRDLQSIVGPSGVLLSEPYSFPPATFKP